VVSPDRNPRKVLPLASLAALALAVGVIGYLRAGPAPHAGRVYLRSRNGPVLFDHARHAAASAGCADCHHETAAGRQPANCRTCHPDRANEDAGDRAARAVEDCYHAHCNACHLAQASARFREPDGTAACSACHLK